MGYTVVSTDAVGQMPLIISFGEGAGIHLALLGGGGKEVLFSGIFWVGEVYVKDASRFVLFYNVQKRKNIVIIIYTSSCARSARFATCARSSLLLSLRTSIFIVCCGVVHCCSYMYT